MSALACLLTAAWITANPPAGSHASADEIASQLEPQAIYGGEEVEPGEWPAVVAVATGKLCTGTLVAPALVLTAAHCFDPEPAGPVQIYFGDDLSSAEVVLSEDWGRHPDFCLPADCGEDIYDFAWVRLPAPVDVEPILPITDQDEFDALMPIGASLWFVGYGSDEDGVVGTKREVEARLVSFNASGREFKAGGEGKDTCQGDSGGPALAQLDSGEWRLAGVISRGGECGQGGIYGVPLPELCWLRDDSGVDLLPVGCETCDCVVLNGDAPDEGCDCEAVPAGDEDPGRWWPALALASVGVGFGLRRRRRRASASPS